MNGTGIMLCDDLIFFSRVAAIASAAGFTVKQARTTAKGLELARQSPPGGVIIDLNQDGLDLPGLLAGLHEIGAPLPRTIGFGSHVDVTTLRAARMSGCDHVMPRSQFVKELETDLKDWLTPHTA